MLESSRQCEITPDSGGGWGWGDEEELPATAPICHLNEMTSVLYREPLREPLLSPRDEWRDRCLRFCYDCIT